MCRSRWTKAFIIGGLLALQATGSPAAVLEVSVIECTAQTTPDQCGIKIRKLGADGDGDGTFTLPDGQVIPLPTGVTVSVSGAGIVSQSTEAAPVVNFASTDSGPDTTASIGVAGSGAGGSGGTGGSGGSGSGPPNPGGSNPPVNTNTFTFTLSGTPGISSSVSPQ